MLRAACVHPAPAQTLSRVCGRVTVQLGHSATPRTQAARWGCVSRAHELVLRASAPTTTAATLETCAGTLRLSHTRQVSARLSAPSAQGSSLGSPPAPSTRQSTSGSSSAHRAARSQSLMARAGRRRWPNASLHLTLQALSSRVATSAHGAPATSRTSAHQQMAHSCVRLSLGQECRACGSPRSFTMLPT